MSNDGTEPYYDECNVPTCDDEATTNAVLKNGDEIAGAVSYCDDHAKERGVEPGTEQPEEVDRDV